VEGKESAAARKSRSGASSAARRRRERRSSGGIAVVVAVTPLSPPPPGFILLPSSSRTATAAPGLPACSLPTYYVARSIASYSTAVEGQERVRKEGRKEGSAAAAVVAAAATANSRRHPARTYGYGDGSRECWWWWAGGAARVALRSRGPARRHAGGCQARGRSGCCLCYQSLPWTCDAMRSMPCVCVALRCVGEGTTWRELPWNPSLFVFADEMGRATSSISVYGVPSYQRVGPRPRPGQPMDPSLVCNYRLFPSPNSTDEELTTALI
jgi:hypothetical protein